MLWVLEVGLGKENVQHHCPYLGGLELLEQLAMEFPGPGPASQLVKGGLIDGDDGQLRLNAFR